MTIDRRTMSHNLAADNEFSRDGLQFLYPGEWQIVESQDGNDITVQVQSPETTFWCVTVMKDRPAPSHAIQTVIDAFQDTYENTDIYDVENQNEDGLFQIAKQIDFVCHDLVNTAKVEAAQTDLATILILAQGFDREMQDYQSLLREMTASVEYG